MSVIASLFFLYISYVSAEYQFSAQCVGTDGSTTCIDELSCSEAKWAGLDSISEDSSFTLLIESLSIKCSGVYNDQAALLVEKFDVSFSNCQAKLPIHVSDGLFDDVDISYLGACKPETTLKDTSLLQNILKLSGMLFVKSLNDNKDVMLNMARSGFGFKNAAMIQPPLLADGSTFVTWTPDKLKILADLRTNYPYDGIKSLASLLTGQTKTIPFTMDGVSMTWAVGASCSMKASFDEISFTGLEDVGKAISFEPPSNPTTSLAIKVPIDSLTIKCPVQLVLDCGDEMPAWEDSLVLHTEFTDVLVSLDMFVALTQERLNSLYVDQLMFPECLMQTFDAIYLNDINFDMNIKKYFVSSADSFAGIFNNILIATVPKFPELVTEVVRGVASGPLKSSVNDYVSKRLSGLNCPKHIAAEGPPKYVQLSHSDAKDAIQRTISKLLSALGIDDAVIASGNAHFGEFFAEVSSKVFGWDSFLENSYSRLVNMESSAVEVISRVYDNESIPLGSYGSCLESDGCARLMSRWSAATSVSSNAVVGVDVMAQFFINVGVVAKLDANKIQNLQYKDILNPDCLLSTFDDVSVTQLLTRKSKKGDWAVSAMESVLAVLPSADLLGALNAGIQGLLSDSNSACEKHDDSPLPLKETPAAPPVQKARKEDCTQQDDPLQCAINNIVVGPFPEICIEISTGDELCIDQLTCFDMDMSGIPSGYIAPTTFMIGIEGMAVTCRADWAMSGVKGVLDGTIKDFTSAMSLNTRVFDTFPISVSVEDCSVESVEVELVFSGGSRIVTALLNSLSGLGEKALEKAITALLCETLDEAIADGLTVLLTDTIDPWLQDVVAYGPSEPPILPDDINWHETPIETIHSIISSIDISGGADGKIMDCLLTAASQDKSSTMSRLLDYMAIQIGDIKIPIDQTFSVAQNASFYFDNLVISGFRTVENLKLLGPSPVSNITLISEIELASFSMTLNAVVTIGSYVERVKIELDLKNVTLEMDLVLGVNRARWNGLYLDQLSDFSCWQSTIDELSVSSLVVDMILDNVAYVQVFGDAGPLEKDVVSLVDNLFLFLTEGFEGLVTDVMVGLFQGPIRKSVNELLADRLADRCECPAHNNSESSIPDWIVWANSPFIGVVDKIFDDILGAAGINTFFTCATGGTGSATISVMDGAWTIILSGLNSFYDFSLLLPVENEPYDLYNSIGIGFCPDAANCNKFGIDLLGTTKGNPFELQLLLENTKIVLGLFMEMNKNDIGDLQVSTFGHDGCKMSTIDELSVYDFAITTRSCELIINGGSISENITKIVDALLGILTSPSMVGKINTNLAASVENSEYICTETVNPASIDNGDNGGGSNDSIFIIVLCCSIAVVLIILSVHFYVFGSDDKSFWTFFYRRNIVETFFPTIWVNYRLEETLMFNPNISLLVRIMTPLFIMGTIALFVYSNSVYAVDVMIELDLGDRVATPPPLFSFSLQNTVEDMWNAEVYPLAILIAFFSGAWPYIKLCTMMAAWVLPPSIMKIGFRETSLTALDVLGKWSLIDAYVMVMMMVAFHVELDLADNLAVIITVVSKTGFYTFITASIASLIAGHIVLYYHHYIIEMRTAPAEDDAEAIMNRNFPVLSRGTIVKCTPAGKMALVIALVVTGAAIWFGASIETFKFEFRGLVGYLMGQDADAPYSLVSVGTTLPEASGKTSDPGISYLQAAYFLFGVGMPLALIAASLVLWVVPLKLKMQQKLFLAAEIFNAWSALDVFVVSIIAALLEIQQFAAFIVGDACDSINELLEENWDEELHGDDKCFDVVAILLTDIWTISTAAVLMVVVCYPVLMMYGKSIDTRLHEIGVRQTFAFRTKSIEGIFLKY